jgi:hypothetical protein
MASFVTVSLSLPSSELPALLAMAAKNGVKIDAAVSKKVKKAKKEKDPNAPKKEPNSWIKFTQHVREVLLAGGCELKGFIGQQYCKDVKGKLPTVEENGKQVPDYDSISDEDLLSGFKSWTPPEQSAAAAARASKASSEAGSDSEEAPPSPSATEKPKRTWSDAAKAKAKERAAAKKAAKAEAPVASPPKPAAAPAPVVPSAPVKASKVKVAAPPPPPPVVEGDITEFAPVIINKRNYLRNCRGDILDEKYEWVGRYDGKSIDTKFAKPADLEDE